MSHYYPVIILTWPLEQTIEKFDPSQRSQTCRSYRRRRAHTHQILTTLTQGVVFTTYSHDDLNLFLHSFSNSDRFLPDAEVLKTNSAQSEWLELCSQLSLSADLSQKWWLHLSTCYGHKIRHYHTMDHISDMLNHLKRIRGKVQRFQEVSLAIFFHDVIYDPKARDNEERSAENFMEFVEDCLGESIVLKDVGIDPVRVRDMILMTIHHKTEIHNSTDPNTFGTDDIHYFLDCDMAILGQERKVYRRYSAAIRQEYIHIDVLLFQQRRKFVLQAILKSPKIFATRHFYDLYEDVARTNIQDEIVSLTVS